MFLKRELDKRIMDVINRVIISISAAFYNLVSWTYQLFLALAETTNFDEESFASIANNMYKIVAVVALFVVAYNVITFIIDPDKDKGSKETSKLVGNLITSIVLILLSPVIFKYLYKIQEVVLNQGIIQSIFVDSTNTNCPNINTIVGGGRCFASQAFSSFFHNSSGEPDESIATYAKYPSMVTVTSNASTVPKVSASDLPGSEKCSEGKPFYLAENLKKSKLSKKDYNVGCYDIDTYKFIAGKGKWYIFYKKNVFIDATTPITYTLSGTKNTLTYTFPAGHTIIKVGKTVESSVYISDAELLSNLLSNNNFINVVGGVYRSQTGSNSLVNILTLAEAKKIMTQDGYFNVMKYFASDVTDDVLDFDFVPALLSGIFLVYIIVTYCFDAAVRIFQLIFYQIIAPICIGCRVLPKGDKIFSNWLKGLWKVYVSVFIRVFMMMLVVYMFNSIWNSNLFSVMIKKTEATAGIISIGTVLLLLGLFMFLKKAPTMIEEVFGIQLNGAIRDRINDVKDGIKASGLYTVGAIKRTSSEAKSDQKLTGKQKIRDIKNDETLTPDQRKTAIRKQRVANVFNNARAGISGTIAAIRSGAADASSLNDVKRIAKAGAVSTNRRINKSSEDWQEAKQNAGEGSTFFRKAVEFGKIRREQKYEDLESGDEDITTLREKIKSLIKLTDNSYNKAIEEVRNSDMSEERKKTRIAEIENERNESIVQQIMNNSKTSGTAVKDIVNNSKLYVDIPELSEAYEKATQKFIDKLQSTGMGLSDDTIDKLKNCFVNHHEENGVKIDSLVSELVESNKEVASAVYELLNDMSKGYDDISSSRFINHNEEDINELPTDNGGGK